MVGRKARMKVKDWTKGATMTPERVMAVVDGQIERGEYRDALTQIDRCLELCATPEEKAKHEPVALFKKGECRRALKQEKEAAAVWQELFRKHGAHALAPKAAMEAVRSLSRAGEPAEAMEKLIDEIEKRKLGGESASLLKYLRAEILENRKQYKAAAGLFLQIEESFEAFDDALVSAGHCLRLDEQPAAAEAALKRALARTLAPRLLFTAHHEMTMIVLNDRPKEALEHLAACTKVLPPESTNVALLLELEIRAHLSLKDLEKAADRLAVLLRGYPDSVSTLRSCRRVAARLESTNPAKAAQYYRTWLEHASTTPTTSAELQPVAEALYRIARAVNGMDDNAFSAVDLKGAPVRNRASWLDALRAHELLIGIGGLAEKDAVVASTRLLWCAGLAGDWAKAKTVAEKLLQDHRLLQKDGTIDREVLAGKTWLAGVAFEYGHALYQLGKAGQKFQFGNALTAFNNLVRVTQGGSETWWKEQYWVARTLFERGEGTDLRDAGALLSNLERNNPGFDGGKYGMKDRFVELRDQVRELSRPQR
jgi:tetratricopeptide (TPR) repeat protein